MKRFSRSVWFGIFLLPAIGLLTSGCRPAVETGGGVTPSTTTSPSTTAPWRSPSVTASPGLPPVEAAAIDNKPEIHIVEPVVKEEPAAATPPPSAMAGMTMVPIQIELPAPAFRGTPVPLKEPNVEKPRGGPRPPFLAPEGTVNLARGMPVSASDPMPVAGELDFVTDGAKEASDFGYLELHPGTQWVQIDLGKRAAVYAVVIWHNHAEARVYRDVVVQASDDPDFLDATTVFNNDYDNSSGLGIGSDMGYVETSEGKLVNAKGAEGRYVRVYGNGSNIDGKNHYTEVEVYGRPVE